MTPAIANLIYDILVEHAGADDRRSKLPDQIEWTSRMDFVHAFTCGKDYREYRFQGSLGFGGKFYSDDWRVGCYREDDTPARLQAIERTNRALAELRESLLRQQESGQS